MQQEPDDRDFISALKRVADRSIATRSESDEATEARKRAASDLIEAIGNWVSPSMKARLAECRIAFSVPTQIAVPGVLAFSITWDGTGTRVLTLKVDTGEGVVRWEVDGGTAREADPRHFSIASVQRLIVQLADDSQWPATPTADPS